MGSAATIDVSKYLTPDPVGGSGQISPGKYLNDAEPGAVDLPEIKSVSSPAAPPGFFHRIAEQFGLPTSREEAQTAQEGMAPHWSDLLIPGGPVGRSMATGLYGAVKRGVATAAQEGTEAGQNIAEGQPVLPNVGKAAYGGVVGGLQAASGVPVVGSLIGTAPLQVGEDVTSGNKAGLAGDITGAALQSILLKAGSKAKETVAPKDLSINQASERVINAVNPPAEHVPTFRKALNQHLQKVVDHAAENNMPLENRGDLVKAINATAEKYRIQYNEDFLGPVRDDEVSTAGIPGYEGGTVDHNTATLGQLNERLGKLNADLDALHGKGQPSARAAVRGATDLNAESKAIRNKLYPEIAERTGLDPKLVADTNQAAGALGNVGARSELALNTETEALNKAKQAPQKLSVLNPLNPDFILDKPASAAYNKLRGSPADRAVASTFQRLRSGAPNAPVLNPPQPAPFPRQPSWQGSEPPLTQLPSIMDTARGKGNVGVRPPLNPAPPQPAPFPRAPTWQVANQAGTVVPSIMEESRGQGNVGTRPPVTAGAAPFPRMPIYKQVQNIMEMIKSGEISPGEGNRRINALGGKTAIRRLP